MENISADKNGFQVSEIAAEKFREIIDSLEERPAGVRIYNSAGCCGSAIQMELAEKLKIGEVQFDIKGVRFFVAEDLLPVIKMVTIDFADESFRMLGYNSPKGCCGG